MNAYASFWPDGVGATHHIGIRNHEVKFEKFFTSRDADWVALNIGSDELERRLNEIGFRSTSEEELKSCMARTGHKVLTELPLSLKRRIQYEITELDPSVAFEPEFPFEAPYPYQDEAYQNWCEAGYKGLLQWLRVQVRL